MGQKLLDLPDALVKGRRAAGFFDDFDDYVSGRRWTTSGDTGTGASAAVDADGVGGLLTLTTGATDNNEAYLLTTNELFKIVADKPLLFEALIDYDEANTDDANVACGFMDAVGADSILDNGAGPKASYSGAVIFKVDGETVWQFETSIGGTQTTTKSKHTAGGAAQELRIEIRPINSTEAEAIPFIDGAQMRDANDKLIKHTITFASATEMNAFVGAKAGGANSEVVNVDYVAAYQLRPAA